MSQALQKYLDRVLVYANRNETDAVKIRAELEDHLLQKIADLEASGLCREDAVFGAIEDHGHPRTVGYGLRKRFPLVDVRTHGTARGFIAIGPKAVGLIAIGGAAFGLFAFGGFALGLVAFGGFALAALLSFGGFSVALIGLAYGGFAVGLVAIGGFACGIMASGGFAAGLWVPQGGKIISYFTSETVPNYLRHFDGLLSGKRLATILWAVCMAILTVVLTTQGLLTKKEYNRIKKADPKLVE